MKNIMKRTLSCILVLTMLLTIFTVSAVMSVSAESAETGDTVDVWDGTVGTGFDGGTGTSADPYLIRSAKTLAYLAQLTNTATHAWNAAQNPTMQKHYKLMCDIDLNHLAWTPIGYFCSGAQSGAVTFSGTFQGEGHVIYHLNATTYVNGKDANNVCVGLFGAVFFGKIYNLGIESGTVTCTGGYAGGIAGAIFNASVIEHCYSKANIIRDSASFTMMGGITGKIQDATGSVSDCINYGSIDGIKATAWQSGNNCFGGIAGLSKGTITGCISYGAIANGNGGRSGGIAGRVQAGTVSSCYASGDISGGNAQHGILFGIVEAGSCINLSYYAGKQTDAAPKVAGSDASSLLSGNVTQYYGEMMIGASIRCDEPTGLRFETEIDADQYESWLAGADSIKVGTLIAPAQYVIGADAFTHAALDAYQRENGLTSASYIDVSYDAAWRKGSTEDQYIFSGAVANIFPANYTMDFAAVGYIAVTVGEVTTYYYASYNARDHFRSIKTVVDAVLADADHGLSDEHYAVVQKLKATLDATLKP